MDPRLGFLLDEHVNPALSDALRRRASEVAVFEVGRAGAPPRGTPDPELLRWAEANHCVLVSRDRASLPVHLTQHLADGGHVPGVVILRRHLFGWGDIADELLLLWAASTPLDRADRITYLPF